MLCHLWQILNIRKEILLWHTLLVMVASAADLALLSVLYLQFLRETHSTLSTLEHASTAVLALLSALYQLFPRVESKQTNNKEQFVEFTQTTALFYLFIWRSRMNEEMLCISECAGTQCPFSRFANFVNCGSHNSSTVPIGPCLCLAIIISATPFFSVSLL